MFAKVVRSSLMAILATLPHLNAQNLISWSQPNITQTMFPGTTMRIPLRFTSTVAISDVSVSVTPSLTGVVSTTPSTFHTISANQEYTLSVLVTAAPTFQRRSLGGTLHLESSNIPRRTYARPLLIVLNIDFGAYTDARLGLTFSYPVDWTITQAGDSLSLLSPARAALRALPEEVESPPEITIAVLSNPERTPLVAFADGFESGWFGTYALAALRVVGGREARQYSDLGAAVGHAPLEAAFVAADRAVVLLTLNDPESEENITLVEVFRGCPGVSDDPLKIC